MVNYMAGSLSKVRMQSHTSAYQSASHHVASITAGKMGWGWNHGLCGSLIGAKRFEAGDLAICLVGSYGEFAIQLRL